MMPIRSSIHLICDDQGSRVRTYCGRVGDRSMVAHEYTTDLNNIFEAVPVRDLDFVSCKNCVRWYEREQRNKSYDER